MMDEHRSKATDKTGNANGGAAGVNSAAARNESKTPQPPRAVEKELAPAKTVADELIDRATTAASDAMASMANTLGERAQDIAGRAHDQAAATTDAVYQQGRRAGDYLSRSAVSNPLTTLLVAGAVGYALSYLIHRR